MVNDVCSRFRSIKVVTKDRVLDALTRARELQKIGYTKGAWALDEQKKSVDPWAENAVCFCGEGAIIGACHYEEDAEALQATCITFFQVANKEFQSLAQSILRERGNTSRITKRSVVPTVNDRKNTTKEIMVQMFDNTILLVEASKWPN